MRRKSSILGMAALAVVLALPAVRASAAAATAPASDVTKSMQQAKQTAYHLRETADRLHAITRSGGHSWQSHSWYFLPSKTWTIRDISLTAGARHFGLLWQASTGTRWLAKCFAPAREEDRQAL